MEDFSRVGIDDRFNPGVAIPELKDNYPFSVFGVIESTVDAAIKATENKKIGIIGTPATVKSDAYAKLIKEISPDCETISVACPLFVPLVEEGLLEDPVTEEIARSGYPAIVGPSMSARSKKEVCESDFKTPGILKQADVTVAITTDHPVCRLQYLPLCAALAAKEGLSDYDALRAITIDAARICRVDNRLGSLAAGKDADLCLWDGNPLEIRSSVVKTLINGSVVWEKDL